MLGSMVLLHSLKARLGRGREHWAVAWPLPRPGHSACCGLAKKGWSGHLLPALAMLVPGKYRLLWGLGLSYPVLGQVGTRLLLQPQALWGGCVP